MKQVSREEYYRFISEKDVVLNVIGNYPYTAEWSFRGGKKVIAKSIEKIIHLNEMNKIQRTIYYFIEC